MVEAVVEQDKYRRSCESIDAGIQPTLYQEAILQR